MPIPDDPRAFAPASPPAFALELAFAAAFAVVLAVATALGASAGCWFGSSGAQRPRARAPRTPAEAGPRQVVRLASGEWRPYLSRELPQGGVAARIVTAALRDQGLDVAYQCYPWARGLELTRRGSLDGTLVWFDTPERRAAFHVSAPVIDVQFCLFHLRDQPLDWRRIEDLEGLSLGLLLPSKLSPSFEEALAAGRLRVERAPQLEINVRKLLARRLDAVITDVDVGLELLRTRFAPDEAARVTYHPRPVHARSMHVLLSRAVAGNARRAAALDAGLERLRERGDIDRWLRTSREGQ